MSDVEHGTNEAERWSNAGLRFRAMGLLAVDVAGFGVVMSADSQRVELLDGEHRVLAGGPRTRNPILLREGGGFTGLVGYVGTEEIGGKNMRDWLDAFSANHANETVAEYANALAAALTSEWQQLGLVSILEVFITGVKDGDLQFWYVRNSQGLYDHDWTFKPPSAEFRAVNDLDENYVPRDLQPGQTKEELLQTILYSLREGVLLPAAPVFDAFATILGTIYAHGVDGFDPVASLDDLAYFARQRMEFLKRLYSNKHGIYRKSPAPLGGTVHVLGVTPQGAIREYPKQRAQVKTLRSGFA
jgi:hypothetical protein